MHSLSLTGDMQQLLLLLLSMLCHLLSLCRLSARDLLQCDHCSLLTAGKPQHHHLLLLLLIKFSVQVECA
jgi:hypothetical protein